MLDNGVIVGRWFDAHQIAHGFLRSADGSFTSIEVSGAVRSYAVAINNAGVIAGFYRGADSVPHGFVLSQGVYSTLDFPGADDTIVLDINDRGQIAGGYNGFTAGFIATPMRGH